MKKWFVAIGVTVLIGTVGFYGYKQYSKPSQAEFTVKNYVQAISQGNTSKAFPYLTGEAKERMAEIRTNTSDPLQSIKFVRTSENANSAEIAAKIVTQKDVITEDFYLIKQQNNWKIFSIQLVPENWSNAKSFSLTPAQKKSIDLYTEYLANGDVKNALNMLVGDARIRAANTPNTIPKQTIRVDKVTPEIELSNGDVLALVQETINGDKQETLLYTLAKDQAWKITNIRLIERR